MIDLDKDDDDLKFMESPLEDIFGIEKGSTLSPIQVKDPDIVDEGKDAEDKAIASQLATVYDYALESFETQTQLVNTVDPKFAARNSEVAALYLRIALDSVNTRAKIKTNKDKLNIIKDKQGSSNPDLITADRNELLRLFNKSDD